MFKRLGSILRGSSTPQEDQSSDSINAPEDPAPRISVDEMRKSRISTILNEQFIDLESLKKLVWSGSSREDRWKAWAVCLGYLPPQSNRHADILSKKRSEYQTIISSLDLKGTSSVLKQIRLDIPRTFMETPGLQEAVAHGIMERILFAWSSRNLASSYVQGINDILVPILAVLIHRHDSIDDNSHLQAIEADAYFMLTKLLAEIQDHYIFGQPGIQTMVLKLSGIVAKAEPELAAHFQAEQLDLLHITFRWFNCLLVRELSLDLVLRIWDACVSEGNGFSVLIVYVSAVILKKCKSELVSLDFAGMMLMFQRAPGLAWHETEGDTLLAEAFVLKSLFEGSAHISSS